MLPYGLFTWPSLKSGLFPQPPSPDANLPCATAIIRPVMWCCSSLHSGLSANDRTCLNEELVDILMTKKFGKQESQPEQGWRYCKQTWCCDKTSWMIAALLPLTSSKPATLHTPPPSRISLLETGGYDQRLGLIGAFPVILYCASIAAAGVRNASHT
jgi:hypothetical protein